MPHPPLRRAALFLLLAALTVAAWWWPNRPQAADVAMPAARFNSVSFAPFRPGQSPLTETFPSEAEVAADLALVAPRVRAIRTYASREGKYDIAAMARAQGLKLWLGIWLGRDPAANAREIAAGIAIARAHPETVERVIVGNEVLLRKDLPVADLTAAIDRVRAAVPEPVTYADVWEFWERNPQIAAHVDFVTVHLLPYWEDDPTGIERAVAHVRDVYHRMVAAFPGKPVVIGETGWPSGGRWRRDAAPSRVNQAVFLRRFIAAAQAEGFDYNLIEAFDQVWKSENEGTMGARWGLWTADRAAKFPLSGAVVEDPDWRWRAAASVAVACVLMAVSGGRLLVLCFALGAALAFAWSGTVPVAFSRALQGAAAVNLAGQAALAVLLLGRIGRGGRTALPVAATAEALRGLLRLRLPPRATWFDHASVLFAVTALVLQILLAVDSRYRDFPLPVFAVPLVAVVARAAAGDWTRGGGGREEAALCLALVAGAVASAVQEGALNTQSLVWNAAVLVLAAPFGWRLLPVRTADAPARRDRVRETTG